MKNNASFWLYQQNKTITAMRTFLGQLFLPANVIKSQEIEKFQANLMMNMEFKIVILQKDSNT